MITKRQKQVLDFIFLYHRKKGYIPSLKEICKKFKLASVSTAHFHIKKLQDLGFLGKQSNKSRSIVLYETEKMVNIPLLGLISAGQPIETIQNKETIAVSQNKLPRSGEFYALRVMGNSMIDENINDGDIVLVKYQETAENGQKVVALIDNYEATLKKIFKERGYIRLQPANKTIEPIIIKKDREIAIKGIVIDVIKNEEALQLDTILPKAEIKRNIKTKNENSSKERVVLQKTLTHQHQYIKLPKDTEPLVIIGDVIEKLKIIPDKSINCIVTSPPYWGQRDYGIEGQIGNEKTPKEYIKKMLDIASELKRVLADDGAYFLNIGDKYIDKNLQMIPFRLAIEMQQIGWAIRNVLIWRKTNAMPSSIKDRFSNVYEPIFLFVKNPDSYLNPEYYFDLDSIRIIHRANMDNNSEKSQRKTLPMDLPTEKISNESELPLTLSIEEYEKWKYKINNHGNGYNGKFKDANKINLGASPGARLSVNGEFYSKQRNHKIDTDLELEIINFIKRYKKIRGISSKEIDKIFNYKDTVGHWFRTDKGGRCLPKPEDWFRLKEILRIKENKYDRVMTEEHYVLQTVRPHELGKNPGDVWDFATGKLQDSHFAIFPEELPRRAIMACCPKNRVVLDPFVGSGTTLKVAKELHRKSIGIELQKNYLKIIKKRCGKINVL